MLTKRFCGDRILIRESKYFEETVLAERQAKVLDRFHRRHIGRIIDRWSFHVLQNFSGNRSTSIFGEASILVLLDSGCFDVGRLYFAFDCGSL